LFSILGGAALQRCDNSALLNAASAAEVEPDAMRLATVDPGPRDDPPTEMQKLREALAGPYRTRYADYMGVLKQFGL
jgi:hypothetical protein